MGLSTPIFIADPPKNDIKVNREKLYELYITEIFRIADECDWKTSFDAQEIVYIISKTIEDNPEIIERYLKK